MEHLGAGTEVRLTRELTEEEHACTGLVLPVGCRGTLVQEDGDIGSIMGFRPKDSTPSPFGEGRIMLNQTVKMFVNLQIWCCYLDREDYEFDVTPYEDDPNLIEVTKGVFVSVGDAIYIVDDCGEVTSWNQDEWSEDSDSVTACAVACIVAAQNGASAVRKNIELSLNLSGWHGPPE